jgi:hypothetical protein
MYSVRKAKLSRHYRGQYLTGSRASVEDEPLGERAPRRCKEKNSLPFIFHFRGPYRPTLCVAVGGPFVGRDCGWTGLRTRGEGDPLLSFLARRLLVSRELLRYLGGIRQP